MPRKRRSSNTSGGNPRKARKVYAKDTPETQVYEVEQILGRRDKDGVGWYIFLFSSCFIILHITLFS